MKVLSWLTVLVTGVFCLSQAYGEVILYPRTPGAVQSSVFKLEANGKQVFVEKFKDIHYARLAFNGSLMLRVQVHTGFEKYTLSPVSYGIQTIRQGNSVSFRIEQSRKLVLQLSNPDEKLFIFADEPETDVPVPGRGNVLNVMKFVKDNSGRTIQTQQLQAAIDEASLKRATLFVPDGKYLTGTLIIKPNVRLYLSPGALIQGSGNLKDYHDNGDNSTGKRVYERGALVYLDEAHHAKIFGRGVLAMEGTKIKTETGIKIRVINVRATNVAEINDIIIRDSGGFTIHLQNSNNLVMRGYKIINDLNLPNEDGTDPDGCNGVVVDDVFMYTSDDAVAIKADHRMCENILVKNCVFWTVKSALKVGSDPRNGARNIVFQNNDIIHADRALAVYTGKGIVSNIKFIDNKSEFVGGNAKRQLIVFQISNAKEKLADEKLRGIGSINGIEVINYTAYRQSERPSLISGTIAMDGTVHKVSNVTFRNLVIEGKHCLSAEGAHIITAPKELPADPNIPAGELKKRVSEFQLDKALQATDNIRFF
jgi:hypothetical protein